MNRLILSLMLVSFNAQQFLCCCAGACVSSCEQLHNHELRVSSLNTEACCCGHGHESETKTESPDRKPENGPEQDKHQHHLCVGNHVFYVSAERFEISRLVISDDFTSSWSTTLEWLASQAARPRPDNRPPPLASISRSVLGVYRI